MPLAMQIAAHAFDEPTVYRIAHAYCEAAGTIITADPKTQPRLVGATHCGGGVAPSSSSIPLSSPAKAGDPVLPVSQFGYDGED